MKNIIKNFIQKIQKKCSNTFINIIYKFQIKYKFLANNDYIDNEFKNDIKKYWSKYNINININWHRWYISRNQINDKKYIPEYIFYSVIEPHYNKVAFNKAYTDKSIQNIWFKDVKLPQTIIKNISGNFYNEEFKILTKEDAVELCSKENKVIIKPAIDSGGGRNICFIDSTEVSDMKNEIKNIIEEFDSDYIIQKVLEQHEDLKCINPESINTIRVMSLLFKGKVHILSSVLRMGVNGAKVDNQAAGGISCGISTDGKLKKYAFDKNGVSLEQHPQGFKFDNYSVPSYSKIIDIVNKEHEKLGHFKIISWDFAIDPNGEPILIEYNLRFQEINFHQLGNGPLFGELTDEILSDVFLTN